MKEPPPLVDDGVVVLGDHHLGFVELPEFVGAQLPPGKLDLGHEDEREHGAFGKGGVEAVHIPQFLDGSEHDLMGELEALAEVGQSDAHVGGTEGVGLEDDRCAVDLFQGKGLLEAGLAFGEKRLGSNHGKYLMSGGLGVLVGTDVNGFRILGKPDITPLGGTFRTVLWQDKCHCPRCLGSMPLVQAMGMELAYLANDGHIWQMRGAFAICGNRDLFPIWPVKPSSGGAGSSSGDP